jgi:ABC-type transport system substrate-binding protein
MPRRANLSIHPRRIFVSSRISFFFPSLGSLRLCGLCVNSFSVFFLFLALATVSLSDCSSHNHSDPSSLTFLIESSPTNLDPRFATDSQSQRIDGLLFSGLLERDNQMNFHGDLAESWSTPDPLTYVFHLRRGVRFHDGCPLTAVDVKATFDFIMNSANKSPKRGALRMVRPTSLARRFRNNGAAPAFSWNSGRSRSPHCSPDVAKGNFQITYQRWVGANTDPDFFEYAFSSKRFPPDGANRGHYRNARIDALTDQIRVEMNQEKRKELCSEVQKILAEDLPCLPMWFNDVVSVHRRSLGTLELPSTGNYNFLATLHPRGN